ncbi:hypothetical protein J4Q44_G00285830 [Coregonus suidteri]|uniref:Uncharacterized protein n=1 Tax=Coregonus suidteri TaxID=861788 RepID=A0AAN8QDD5_9TELE
MKVCTMEPKTQISCETGDSSVETGHIFTPLIWKHLVFQLPQQCSKLSWICYCYSTILHKAVTMFSFTIIIEFSPVYK